MKNDCLSCIANTFAGAEYQRPAVEILNDIDVPKVDDKNYTDRMFQSMVERLAQHDIQAEPADVFVGATVTQFFFNVLSCKFSKSAFNDIDIAMQFCLECNESIRVTPPAKLDEQLCIEVPNHHRNTIGLRTMLENANLGNNKAILNFAMGQSVSGEYIWRDLAYMPHLLIAGTTGSGKSVVLNNMIISMMYQYSPEYLRFILVDPKQVELSRYNGCPHLLTSKAITEMQDALASLEYLSDEMEKRYRLFRDMGVRSIVEYNDSIDTTAQKMPYIIFVVDELADLMCTCRKAAEHKILQLAQKSRACGIHMVLATQRPNVDVITGTIKANFPARIALKVVTAVDSKIVLDNSGAEKLLGNGDMLFADRSSSPIRLQSAFVSNDEIDRVVDSISTHNKAVFSQDIHNCIFGDCTNSEPICAPVAFEINEVDSLCKQALHIWLTECDGNAPISALQRKLGVGFNRACKITDYLVSKGYVAEPPEENGKRKVLVTADQLAELFPDQVKCEVVPESTGSAIEVDPLCKKALHICLTQGDGYVAISRIQRMLGLGFNRACKIVQYLDKAGYIETDDDGRNKIVITIDQLDKLFPDQSID